MAATFFGIQASTMAPVKRMKCVLFTKPKIDAIILTFDAIQPSTNPIDILHPAYCP